MLNQYGKISSKHRIKGLSIRCSDILVLVHRLENKNTKITKEFIIGKL